MEYVHKKILKLLHSTPVAKALLVIYRSLNPEVVLHSNVKIIPPNTNSKKEICARNHKYFATLHLKNSRNCF